MVYDWDGYMGVTTIAYRPLRRLFSYLVQLSLYNIVVYCRVLSRRLGNGTFHFVDSGFWFEVIYEF